MAPRSVRLVAESIEAISLVVVTMMRGVTSRPPAAMVNRRQFKIEFLTSATLPELLSHVKINSLFHSTPSHISLSASDWTNP